MNSRGCAGSKFKLRRAGESGRAPRACQARLRILSAVFGSLKAKSQSGGSPRVANWPWSSIQYRRASEPPEKSPACDSDMLTTNERARSWVNWAARVVAWRCCPEALSTCLVERWYQESATIPCWAGQAPVARLAMLVEGKVAARLEQS